MSKVFRPNFIAMIEDFFTHVGEKLVVFFLFPVVLFRHVLTVEFLREFRESQ